MSTESVITQNFQSPLRMFVKGIHGHISDYVNYVVQPLRYAMPGAAFQPLNYGEVIRARNKLGY